MAGLQGGNDAFGAAQVVEGVQGLLVRDAHVLGAAQFLQPGVLGADAGIVKAGADAVRLGDLAVLVLQDEGAVAVQHAAAAALQRGRVLAAVQALARSLDADQARVLERDVGVEDAHGIAAAAHAGDHGVGLAVGAQELGHLREAFLADDLLEVAHHRGIGVGAGHGADDVEGVVHVGHPVAHGLVERILERAAARFHRHHGGAQQAHAVDVGALALHVLGAHVDDALEAVARADGGRGHAVLAGARLGNDAGLAHAPGEHGLADHVVDLVRARVVEVFALEVDLRAAHLARHACRVVDGRGAADEMGQLGLEFGNEFRVVLVLGVGVAQLGQSVCQGFAGKAAAEAAKVARCVRVLVFEHGLSAKVGHRPRARRR